MWWGSHPLTRPDTAYLRVTITAASKGAPIGISEISVYNYLRDELVLGADISYADQNKHCLERLDLITWTIRPPPTTCCPSSATPGWSTSGCASSDDPRDEQGGAYLVLAFQGGVVVVTAVAYLIALRIPQSIFDVATRYAFAGYASLVPLLVAALFWKNSTRWGALATTLWTAAAVMAVAVIQNAIPAPPPGASIVCGDRRLGDCDPRRNRHVRDGNAAGRADDPDVWAADDCRVACDKGLSKPGEATMARYFAR